MDRVTGLAIDTLNQSLLVLDTGDILHEYTYAGALIGAPVPTDEIAANGQGLAYDASIGRLFVTTQELSLVTVFDDPARIVPEPSSLLLGGSGFALLVTAALRCRCR
jgi:hypothetical protein